MHSMEIKQPGRISESQAVETLFNAFKHAMANDSSVARMKAGLHAFVVIGEYECYVSMTSNDEWRVSAYTKHAHSPCAVAFCDKYDC